MFLRSLLVGLVVWAGVQFGPRHAARITTVSRDLSVFREASHQFDVGGRRALQAWLKRQRDVTLVPGSHGKTVELRFTDGVRASILPPSAPTLVQISAPFRALARVRAPGHGRAIILEPFATQLGLGPAAGDPEAQVLQNAGFTVDQIYDAQVTLDAMATLHSYNVVYMETHSGVNPGGEGVVATGQVAQAGDNVAATLLQDGSVILVHVSNSSAGGFSDQVYYGITSSYIRNYEGQFPGNSLVFLNGCDTLNAPLFWEALKAKGVSTLLSWSKEATTKDNYLSAAAFFSQMAQGSTVAGAITAVKNAGYGTSQVGGDQAELGYLGNGNDTLAQAAAAPTITSTPVPTHPPVVTPAPTLSPPVAATPTSTPSGPPLTVTLLPRVKPGKVQRISITSRPDTIIHIRIDFPSGDGRTATTATDASGHARFSYPQHTSRVAFNQVFATVSVEALRNGGVTRVVKRYRILWSHLDLAIVPREQAVGKSVLLEAHTTARSRVVVFLHFPSGKHRELVGRTGPKGWVRMTYKVGRYLKRPQNHRVLVTARTRASGGVYHTSGTFRII